MVPVSAHKVSHRFTAHAVLPSESRCLQEAVCLKKLSSLSRTNRFIASRVWRDQLKRVRSASWGQQSNKTWRRKHLIVASLHRFSSACSVLHAASVSKAARLCAISWGRQPGRAALHGSAALFLDALINTPGIISGSFLLISPYSMRTDHLKTPGLIQLQSSTLSVCFLSALDLVASQRSTQKSFHVALLRQSC